MGMTDLQIQTKYFILGCKFNDAEESLIKLRNGFSLSPQELTYFEFLGNLFEQMDMESEAFKSREHPELSVEATRMRPFFYNALSELKITEPRFIKEVYPIFKSVNKKSDLKTGDVSKIEGILHSMTSQCMSKTATSSYVYSSL